MLTSIFEVSIGIPLECLTANAIIFFAADLSTVFSQEVKITITKRIETGRNRFTAVSFGKGISNFFSKNTRFYIIPK